MESVEKIYEDFKKFFDDNNIPVYYNSEPNKNLLEQDKNFMGIEEIKKFILAVKPTFIQLYLYKFEIRDVLTSRFLMGEDEKERFEKLTLELKEINNSYASLNIVLPIQVKDYPSFCFYNDKISEITEYMAFCNEIIDNIKNPENYEEEEYEEEEHVDVIKRKELTKEETEAYINRLLNDSEYVATSIPAYRKDYMFEYFKDELNPSNIAELISKAERALEKFLKEKIRDLKKEGKRKFEIVAELGISKHRIDKYF